MDGYYYQQPQNYGGYEYPVPAVRFDIPEPVQQYNPQSGYVYEQPSNPLIYPEKPAVSEVTTHSEIELNWLNANFYVVAICLTNRENCCYPFLFFWKKCGVAFFQIHLQAHIRF